jgi:hypothetical protein
MHDGARIVDQANANARVRPCHCAGRSHLANPQRFLLLTDVSNPYLEVHWIFGLHSSWLKIEWLDPSVHQILNLRFNILVSYKAKIFCSGIVVDDVPVSKQTSSIFYYFLFYLVGLIC